MSLAAEFFSDAVITNEHFCMPEPTAFLSYRKGLLGQYWTCPICNGSRWVQITEEDEIIN